MGELRECVVCLCKYEEGEEMRELYCKHEFHKDCLDRWLVQGRGSCPLCRSCVLPEVSVIEHSGFQSEPVFNSDGDMMFMLESLYTIQPT